MDIVFVRTKLQAKIVEKLIAQRQINKRFIFVRNYWKNKFEDADQVYEYYERLAEQAFISLSFVEGRGILRNTFLIWSLSILAVISGGKFFFAGINLYSFAISRKINPFLKIYTFDDGSANIRKGTLYYSEKPLPHDNRISRKVVNLILPKGPAFFLRKKINRHFSIFKGKDNIIDKKQICFIDIDIGNQLSKQDIAIINNLVKSKMTIMIASSAYEHSDNVELYLRLKYKSKFDLIILHPRDRSDLRFWKNAHYFDGLAESVLFYLLKNPKIINIELYHYNSTALDSIKDNQKLESTNLQFETTEFFKDHTYKENILVYIDTYPHLRFARDIEKFIPASKFYYVTSNPEIYARLNPRKDFFIKKKMHIPKFCSKEGASFDVILAARVDDLNFQLLYKFLGIKFYTFDEGLFTIQLDSIYNSQITIPRSFGLKYVISSKVLNFPIPASFFYRNTKCHFTKFKKENFSRSVIPQDKVKYLEYQNDKNPIQSVFIGQPWQFMYFSDKAIKQIAKFINNLSPEIYLIHPREDFSRIDSYLNPDISRVFCKSSAEDFMNRLIGTDEMRIYSVASTLVVGVSSSAKIRIVTSEKLDRRVKFGQENLLITLKAQGVPYKVIDISNY